MNYCRCGKILNGMDTVWVVIDEIFCSKECCIGDLDKAEEVSAEEVGVH